MKLLKKAVSATVFLAIAASSAYSAFADNTILAGSESFPTENYVNADFFENVLSDPLSPGIRVMAYERPMIMCITKGNNAQFSSEVFNDYSGSVPSSVKIVTLPDESAGTLVYNSENVSIGQSVSVLSLSSLYYVPKSEADAEFTFSPDNTNIMRCVIRQKDSKNTPPEVTDGSSVTTVTRIDTAVSGYLGGTDTDGDGITYEIVSRPAKGIVSVINGTDGQFVYYPYEGISGDDSFSYRICDSYGAYSEVGTVSLKVESVKSSVYDDVDDSYHIAAMNDAVESGVMKTVKNADGEFFNPSENVSRIDFLIMAMKSLGAGVPDDVADSGFADDDTLTGIEKGYLCAARNLGIVNGSVDGDVLKFMPDDPITGASAAVMLNGMLGLKGDSSIQVSAVDDTVPAWAVSSVTALTDAGIINSYTAPANSPLNRENVAVILSGLMDKIA